MNAFAGTFAVTPLGPVISGDGAVQALPGELERLGRSRVLIVTGRTLGSSRALDALVQLTGGRTAEVFTAVEQHVPERSVCRLVDAARATQADTLLSFGGGSPIDAAKVAIHRLATSGGPEPVPLHLAIPTTLSAGEFTCVAGVTDDATRVKRPIYDDRMTPRVVFTDPTLTITTPDWLWLSSGIRALDHAVESIYSPRHHPLSDAVASRAIALLLADLPASTQPGAGQLAHRGMCQIAAWMAVFGMTNAGFGLSHALGHQIGPRWNVVHGMTSCVTLPHAMRFMAARAPERFAPIAAGLGVPFDAAAPLAGALACADRVAAFVARLGLPQRLRDVDVPRGELPAIAATVCEGIEQARAVEHAVRVDEVEAVLEAAY